MLLRRPRSATRGAVAMTFVNDQGGRFTALRTYYVPRRATRSADVQMQLVTHEEALGLEALEALEGQWSGGSGRAVVQPSTWWALACSCRRVLDS